MAKRVLGRGLDALLSDNVQESAPATGERVIEVALSSIAANPHQPRKTIPEGTIRELANSIREKGILQPVLLRRAPQGGFQIVAGERRCRAAQSLGFATIPAVVRDISDRELLEVALVENVQREDLNELEVAAALEQLIQECGYTHEDLATRLGKDRSSVSNTLRLLKLSERVRHSLASGEISAGHARALAGIADPDQQAAWLKRVAAEGLTVRALERLLSAAAPASKKRKRSRPSARRPQDRELLALTERLQAAVGTRVQIRRAARGGRVEIEFYSDEELERLAEILLRGSQS